jgi:histidinol phosphatase-like enzyme
MILQAAKDLDLDLAGSWLVGDKLSDMEAASAAGVGTSVLYDNAAPALENTGPFWRTPDLGDAVQLLKELQPG